MTFALPTAHAPITKLSITASKIAPAPTKSGIAMTNLPSGSIYVRGLRCRMVLKLCSPIRS